MTISDLIALRTFMEAGQLWLDESVFGPSGHSHWQARERFKALLPAAWEALERVKKDMTNLMDTNDYTGVPKSPPVLAVEHVARIARLEEALRLVLPLAKGYAAEHPVGSNATYVAEAENVLEGRDA